MSILMCDDSRVQEGVGGLRNHRVLDGTHAVGSCRRWGPTLRKVAVIAACTAHDSALSQAGPAAIWLVAAGPRVHGPAIEVVVRPGGLPTSLNVDTSRARAQELYAALMAVARASAAGRRAQEASLLILPIIGPWRDPRADADTALGACLRTLRNAAPVHVPGIGTVRALRIRPVAAKFFCGPSPHQR